MSSDQKVEGHRTVLLQEATDALEIRKDDVVVDATLGGGGHSRKILKRLGKGGALVAFDADIEAIERFRTTGVESEADVHLIHANFRDLKTELHKRGIEHIDKALFDLGWSSYQLSAGRGFSFLSDEPLSMAYDKDQMLSAGVIVNEWREESIADVIYGYGEERYARRIARAIVEARGTKQVETARELAEIVKNAVPRAARFGKTHPATKVFQALRIAVNDELGSLERGLRSAWEMLSPGGRIAVISFHSIEDRIVKQAFVALEKNGEGERVQRKPITPSDEELKQNPRARSAKLRTIEKLWDDSKA